jgi:hypothetical protein
MVVITHARRISRLSRLIDSAGGLSVGVAMKQADANLEPLRERALRLIAEHIAALQTIARPAEADVEATLDQAYRLATAIIDCASPFGLEDLCAVATGLCDLIDDASPTRPFDWRVPAVHAQSMALLMSLPDGAREQRRQVRDGIDSIVARKLSRAG